MFEDSTFETMGRIQTRSRGWMMATLAFNSSILLALVIIPIIHPEMLPQITNAILMEEPAPVQDVRPVVRTEQAQSCADAGDAGRRHTEAPSTDSERAVDSWHGDEPGPIGPD